VLLLLLLQCHISKATVANRHPGEYVDRSADGQC